MREASASLAELERWYLARVLRAAGQNYALAAGVLGLDRSTVRRKARALGSAPGAGSRV